LGLGFAELLAELFPLVPQWPVRRVLPARPQQEVAVLEGVETADLLRPGAGVHVLGLVAGLAGGAAGGGGRVVPVRGRDVVAVSAVLGLDLPVAVVDVGGGTAQDFQAFG